MEEATIQILVNQAKEGDVEAMLQIFERYRPLRLHWARHTYLKDWDIDDLCQESYLILLETLDKYDPQKGMTFGGYYKIRLIGWRGKKLRRKRELGKDYHKRTDQDTPTGIELSSNILSIEQQMMSHTNWQDETEHQVEDQIMAKLIKEEIQKLSPSERKLLEACIIEGHKLGPIAKEMNLTLSGIKSRKRRSVMKIKAKILETK